jgi:metal-responsive CopG/Arc/MetJ family transcriptional regulator
MQEKKSKRSDERSGSTRKNIRFEDDLLNEVNNAVSKTGTSFSEWVKDACRSKLKNKDWNSGYNDDQPPHKSKSITK